MVEFSNDGTEAFFDPTTGFVDFPGGSKKFTIRYDTISKQYLALTNYVPPQHEGQTHACHTRNTVALVSSEDMRNWQVRAIVLYHSDVKKHGFQYLDWLFEGDDIIAASRTAYDDGFGGAARAHDANYLTFHRVIKFRNYLQ